MRRSRSKRVEYEYLRSRHTRKVRRIAKIKRFCTVIIPLVILIVALFLIQAGFKFDKGETVAEAGNDYIETAKVTWYGKDITPFATRSDSIDPKVLGRQKITFSILGKKFDKLVEVVDTTAPTIVIVSNDDTDERGNMIIDSIDHFVDPGAFATDHFDGNVEIEHTLEKVSPAQYIMHYTACDSSGNSRTVDRIIGIYKGDIYLTFDDGPYYPVTNQVLDILELNDVKATFFLVGYNHNTQNEDMVRREYASGHTIGMHGYSHSYKDIYSSQVALYGNYEKMAEVIEETLGITPQFIRFPGGSSNTVSRNYCSGIMTWATQNLKYKYFDWNIDSADSGGAVNSANEIYSNVVDSLHSGTNVVLMHDGAGHQATVDALQMVIDYAKEHGYVFKVIDDDTPLIQHGVNN